MIGCHQKSSSDDISLAISEESMPITRQLPPNRNVKDDVKVEKVKEPEKIIKEADISFQVADYFFAKKQIDSLVKRWGGYISNEDEVSSNYRIENTIIIRVHQRHFESLLNGLGNTAFKVDYKKVNSYDVTEEYVDIQSRLKTKREVEKRYYEILKKATKIEDILRVENEIRKIREEIESQEGRLKYLSDRVSYSTITLNVYQYLEYKYKPSKESNFFTKSYKALDKGWKGLLAFIVALIHIWPVLLGGGIVLIIFMRRKKFKTKSKTKNE